jgi:ribosome maturation factor RimP
MAKKGATVGRRAPAAGTARVGGRDVFGRERALMREIAPLVERSLAGVEVLAVELVSPSRFCVFVDHAEGVDHAVCGRVTHLLERWRGEYTIDVSSPGPNRPLRQPAHFAAAIGSAVSIRTDREIDGQTRFRGLVTAASASAVAIETSTGTLQIPYDAIVRANVIDETKLSDEELKRP